MEEVSIAVLGSGPVARALSAGLVAAGHGVAMGTRSAGRVELREWAAGAGVTTADPASAARGAGMIVNATVGPAAVDAVRAAGGDELGAAIVLDVSNPLDFSSGPPRVYTDGDTSVAEQLQAAFPRLRVVKSLCTVANAIMVDPGLLPEPTTMFIAGDDAAAKQDVAGLLGSLGWAADQILDLGDITGARVMEHNIMLWLRIFDAVGTSNFNVKVVRG